jgi:hypothetical protein
MMPRDLFFAETEEAGGVVVQDIPLLRFAQEWCLLDHGNGPLDHQTI